MKILTYIRCVLLALPQLITILKTVEQLTPDGTTADDKIRQVIKLLESANETANKTLKL